MELGVPEGQCRVEAFGTIKRNPTMKLAKKRALRVAIEYELSSVLNSQLAEQPLERDRVDSGGRRYAAARGIDAVIPARTDRIGTV